MAAFGVGRLLVLNRETDRDTRDDEGEGEGEGEGARRTRATQMHVCSRVVLVLLCVVVLVCTCHVMSASCGMLCNAASRALPDTDTGTGTGTGTGAALMREENTTRGCTNRAEQHHPCTHKTGSAHARMQRAFSNGVMGVVLSVCNSQHAVLCCAVLLHCVVLHCAQHAHLKGVDSAWADKTCALRVMCCIACLMPCGVFIPLSVFSSLSLSLSLFSLSPACRRLLLLELSATTRCVLPNSIPSSA